MEQLVKGKDGALYIEEVNEEDAVTWTLIRHADGLPASIDLGADYAYEVILSVIESMLNGAFEASDLAFRLVKALNDRVIACYGEPVESERW